MIIIIISPVRRSPGVVGRGQLAGDAVAGGDGGAAGAAVGAAGGGAAAAAAGALLPGQGGGGGLDHGPGGDGRNTRAWENDKMISNNGIHSGMNIKQE